MPFTVLIVEDEESLRWALEEVLGKEGFRVLSTDTGEAALEVVKAELPDLVLLDLKLPGMDGILTLKAIKEIDEKIIVVMMTAYGDVETAVQSMKLGALDYINKPFNHEEMKLLIRNALEAKSYKEEVLSLRQKEQEKYKFSNIVGRCAKMQEVFNLMEKVCKSDLTTVLIRGESGTGKQLVAKAIHHNSPRRDKPFMEVNCLALPASLLESELFGYEKGAFTDAKTLKKGLVELADEGTLFLDEVGDMPLEMQGKILKVIEEKSFRRVGGIRDLKVDVRVITATNKNLEEVVKNKSFREDLYYRLNVIPIYLPPLRERREDILLLADHFRKEFNRVFNRNIKGFSKEVQRMLLNYAWPGNVRELKNVIERAFILESGDLIKTEDISIGVTTPSFTKVDSKEGFLSIKIATEGISLEEMEKRIIEKALELTQGNQVRAAKMLKVSRDTLRYRMKKYKLLP